MKRFYIFILIIILSNSLYANKSLDLYPDALSSGLNGAGDTIIQNSYAVYNNPANLIFLFHNELSFSYMHFVNDIKRGTMIYSWKRRNKYPISINISYLTYGSIQQFTTGINEYTIIQGDEINLWSFNGGISTCRRISLFNNYFFIGAKADILINHLDTSYTGLLIHPGIIYYSDFKGWIISLKADNIGLINSFKDTAPLKFKIGIGYRIKRIQGEINYHISEKNIIKLGTRITIFSFLKFIAGFKLDKKEPFQNNISAGVEADFKKLGFHYTIVPKSILGYYHYFSIKREF